MCTTIEYILPKCILWDSEHFIGCLDDHLLQIQICCYKANHSTDITLCRVRNNFPLYLIKYSSFKITAVNLNELHVLCHEPVFCTQNHFQHSDNFHLIFSLHHYEPKLTFSVCKAHICDTATWMSPIVKQRYKCHDARYCNACTCRCRIKSGGQRLNSPNFQCTH